MKTNMSITTRLFHGFLSLALACLAAASLALTYVLPVSGEGVLWITVWITSSVGAVIHGCLAGEDRLIQ